MLFPPVERGSVMLRLEALRLYRREYFHALRNGLNSMDAAQQATTRVKKLFQDTHEFQGIPDIDRQEILDVLIEWTILLKDIPIDLSKVPAKPPLEVINDPTIKPPGDG
jgi:hypothetical protein